MSQNTEENTVKYYDIVYRDWISKKYTDWELEFFKKILGNSGRVLDVGCGSGRHILPLYDLGYQVVGIEPLKNFVDQVKSKNNKVEVLNGSVSEVNIPGSFDLIISMWNAFHQVAYSYEEALPVLKKLKKHLNPSGSIVFSFSPLEEWDVKDYNFTHTVIENNKKYFLTWSVEDYDESQNIVTSKENIKVYDKDETIIDDVTAYVKQKYWSEKELESLCADLGLKMAKYAAQKGFFDNYYVLTIKDNL